jgi:hypothetical protein
MRKFHIMLHQWLTTKIVPYMMEEDKILELLMPKVVDAIMFFYVGLSVWFIFSIAKLHMEKKGIFSFLMSSLSYLNVQECN